MIKYLRLQQPFDAAKMQQEVELLKEELWKEHYNRRHFEGDWSVLPLRSILGDPMNIISTQASSAGGHLFRDTPLLEQCPYIQSVLNFFQCETMSVRLMKLRPASVIKEHRDLEMSFEEGEVRFHIPVTTNPEVGFYLEQERVVMQEGECWYLNLSLPHSVSNAGATDRVHLVIDAKVNEWVKDLFHHRAEVKKEAEAVKARTYSHEEQVQIIAQLRQMNTPTSLELASQMEKERT